MKFSKIDYLAIGAVLVAGGLFILDAMPKLTALIYSMVI